MSDGFGGTIGTDWRDSTPWWPPEPEPPAGAPNVVVVVLDDVGYAQLGCYGSDIDTPVIDRLAAEGVRLTNFHTTALCSPTRAALLTGRNHHSVGMGRIADLAIGYPGHNGIIDRRHGFLPEMLRPHGYATMAVGKWHLTPDDQTHMAADRSSWPVARGFDRWYGFHGGETHQFTPVLFQDNQWVPPPAGLGTRGERPYHLSEDLAETACRYVRDVRAVDPDQPFLLYLAFGACHSPHQAPAEWIDRYRGRFDEGWDVWRQRTFDRQRALGLYDAGTELSPRPSWVPAWDDLKPDDRRVAARFMECFAGFLSHADAQLGRVLDVIEHELGELDDTVVVLLSDNGASAEGGERGSINDVRTWNGMGAGRRELRARLDELGGPAAHNNYPWGWTMAGNTPFRRWKREVHEGGVADPCIIRLPARSSADAEGGRAGSVRRQYAHVIDLVPTLLDLVGIEPPTTLGGVEQSPLEGASLVDVLRDPGAPPARTAQHYEMLGSRALYHDGWKAVTFKPLAALYDDGLDPDAPFDEDRWELYHVAEDFSECHDLAAAEPDRLAALVARWWDEARAHQVLPLDNRPLAALEAPRPSRARRDRPRTRCFPGAAPVPEEVAPNVRNRSHVLTVDVVAPDRDPVEGVLLACGSVLGGWSLHVVDGQLRYVHNLGNATLTSVAADRRVGPGPHRLAMAFTRTAPFAGIAELFVDDAPAGSVEVPVFTPARFSITGGGLTCGYEVGPAVAPDHEAPFAFTGTIERAFVDVSGAPYRDLVAELGAILAAQ